MRLVSFSVEKYRSITKAKRLNIGQTTVLVGPNNEGKSNLLKGLVAAMDVLTRGPAAPVGVKSSVSRIVYRSRYRTNQYNWRDDYPISLQATKPNGESVFELEFELDSAEIADFRKEIKSALNGTLPLRITLGQDTSSITVRKRGRGGKALTLKSSKIAKFVSERVQFRHIPPIRTASLADELVAPMVARELETVESKPEYKTALEEIEKLQQPILDKLAASVQSIMCSFLPDLKSVRFEVTSEMRSQMLRRTRMILDDGSPTYLEYKGDGVQSLAALALMRYVSETGAVGQHLIVAVEEPESHLHPEAIHSLKAVLQTLAERHQVVITTHCPVFVERSDIGANIIVHRQKARPAKSVNEIRDILGVRAADNLRHADLILIVEGEDDVKATKAILGVISPKLRNAISNNTLAIESLAGGSNLSYKLTYLRNAVCLIHCFLDNDKMGLDAVDKAKSLGLLSEADYHLAVCPDKHESEIEDLYDKTVYESEILHTYGVSLDCPKFYSKKKWSDRMRDAFVHQGKTWDDKTEMAVKNRISELVVKDPAAALNQHRRGPIDSLVASILRKLRIPVERAGMAAVTLPATVAASAPSEPQNSTAI